MSNHTPGPWRIGKNFGSVVCDTPVPGIRGSDHTEYYGGHLIAESVTKANARLIAAAPDNYECNIELAAIVRELCAVYNHPLPQASLDRSDAAIAKARGEKMIKDDRLEIKLRLIEQLVENPNFEATPADMEYWEPLHDKLKNKLVTCEALARAVMADQTSNDQRIRNDDRAHRLATTAAEEFIRCNGLPTNNADEFVFHGHDLADEYFQDCIEHLKWVGQCVVFEHDEDTIVLLGDFTLGSLA